MNREGVEKELLLVLREGKKDEKLLKELQKAATNFLLTKIRKEDIDIVKKLGYKVLLLNEEDRNTLRNLLNVKDVEILKYSLRLKLSNNWRSLDINTIVRTLEGLNKSIKITDKIIENLVKSSPDTIKSIKNPVLLGVTLEIIPLTQDNYNKILKVVELVGNNTSIDKTYRLAAYIIKERVPENRIGLVKNLLEQEENIPVIVATLKLGTTLDTIKRLHEEIGDLVLKISSSKKVYLLLAADTSVSVKKAAATVDVKSELLEKILISDLDDDEKLEILSLLDKIYKKYKKNLIGNVIEKLIEIKKKVPEITTSQITEVLEFDIDIDKFAKVFKAIGNSVSTNTRFKIAKEVSKKVKSEKLLNIFIESVQIYKDLIDYEKLIRNLENLNSNLSVDLILSIVLSSLSL